MKTLYRTLSHVAEVETFKLILGIKLKTPLILEGSVSGTII